MEFMPKKKMVMGLYRNKGIWSMGHQKIVFDHSPNHCVPWSSIGTSRSSIASLRPMHPNVFALHNPIIPLPQYPPRLSLILTQSNTSHPVRTTHHSPLTEPHQTRPQPGPPTTVTKPNRLSWLIWPSWSSSLSASWAQLTTLH